MNSDIPKRTRAAAKAGHAWGAHLDRLSQISNARPRLALADYPQLAQIAKRKLPGLEDVTELCAAGLYEKQDDWLDLDQMDLREKTLMTYLQATYGELMSPLELARRLPREDDPSWDWLTPREVAEVEVLTARFDALLSRLCARTPPGDQP